MAVNSSMIKLPKMGSVTFKKMQAVNVPIHRLAQSHIQFNLRENLQEDVFVERNKAKEVKDIVRHTAASQLRAWQLLMQEPFGEPYSMCVSTYESDFLPKMVAATLVAAAFDQGATVNQVAWHTITGDAVDYMLVDHHARKKDLKLIVLANLPTSYDHTTRMDSSLLKYEKVRDIIEVFPNAAVCVVSTGTSPSDLFHKLQLPLDIAIRLMDKRQL
ncbi:DNA polymerase [Pseudomonas phage vB_PpuM-Voja-6]